MAYQARFQVYEDLAGEFRWRLVGSNGQIVAVSGEGYGDKGAAEDAVLRVKEIVKEIEARQ